MPASNRVKGGPGCVETVWGGSRVRRTRVLGSVLAAVLSVALGCGEGEEKSAKSRLTAADWATRLGPPEQFTWDDQPLSFAPPPPDWKRQREQSGGLRGARFVKPVSGGQAIHVAEVTALGKRDRCSELEALLRELDELSQREFMIRLQRSRPYGKDPVNAGEKMAFAAANERLDEARTAHIAGDLQEVRRQISEALFTLRFVIYALDEVVQDALFTGEGYEQFGKIEVFEAQPGELAGKPSVELEYLLAVEGKELLIYGRKVYVEHNNRLFELSFQGVEEYLPLFEALLESVRFPDGACQH
jgi:hypothetical protein